MSPNPVPGDDLIEVDELPAPLRQYLRRSELDAGRVSRRLLRQRQLGAEGRVISDARQHGTTLPVVERHGEKIATTAATSEIDTARATR